MGQFIDKLLTFIGSTIPVWLLIELLSVIDVSSRHTAQAEVSAIWKWSLIAPVGLVFVGTDLLISRRLPTKFGRLLLNTLFVSVAGSVSGILLLALMASVPDTRPFQQMVDGLVEEIAMALPLAMATFIPILILKGIHLLFRLDSATRPEQDYYTESAK